MTAEPVRGSGAAPVDTAAGGGRADVTFENGNHAVVVLARPRQSVAELLTEAGLSGPHPVLVIVGGADGLDRQAQVRVSALFDRGVAPVIEATGAVVVDGGTAAGVMSIAGEILGMGGTPVTMVGVAPAGRVSYLGDRRPDVPDDPRPGLEPNHSHFILANSDRWGGETRLMFEVAEALAGSRPLVVLVAGGGDVTTQELLEATGRHWPVIVLAGTSGVADSLAATDEARRQTPEGIVDDRSLAAIVDRADLAILARDADPAVLERLLGRRLQPDETLRMAWHQYGGLSAAAKRQQRSFNVLQRLILGLGVLVTTLVVVQVVIQLDGGRSTGSPLMDVLHYAIVIVPITVAALAATAGRLRPGNRWVQIRGTAESIKGNIFRYRARAGRYAPNRTRDVSREVKLAAAVGSAMQDLMQTDVNLSVVGDEQPASDPAAGHTAPGDDGVRPLSPDDYLRFRVDDQIAYYQAGVRTRERQARMLRWLMISAGAFGTFLAAALLEPWVAVTTAIVGATATYLEAMQLESSIMLQNRAATDLATVRAWWLALSPDEQLQPRAVDRLVDRAERIMGAEHHGWLREMQDAISHLRLEDDEAEGRPQEPTESSSDTDAHDDEVPSRSG